jgi:predicted ABC-type ATPase
MFELIADCVRRGESFAFETTLSGLGYARWIPQWRSMGYKVVIFFLGLSSADLAAQRVADRVAQGGHDIPEPMIRRRFASGRKNFENIYKALADEWKHYDNSGDEPVLVASSSPDA